MAVFETFFQIGSALGLGVVLCGVLPACIIIRKMFFN